MLILFSRLRLVSAYFMGYRGVEIAVIIAAYFSPIAVSSYVMAKNENSDYAHKLVFKIKL